MKQASNQPTGDHSEQPKAGPSNDGHKNNGGHGAGTHGTDTSIAGKDAVQGDPAGN